ncbi:MAG: sigma-70 family RNA polymerase sigma factor [Phycisphaeraceae bacterium]|nr:sigma-70 family RNA polymerase sigma factor [Phycisphaeraceae bacterium]MCW5753106.1 sigma-70 family RNA polymerase sigma factor [Phycisphaeraceae bacterium]
MDNTTDEQLFEQYRRGRAEALRTIIERYKDDLFRFLYRLLGDRAAAEDVFQEAFLQIHLSADTFDASRRFRPWLFTIAANKGRDYLRRKGRRQAMELSAPIGGETGADNRGASYVDLMQIDVPPPDAAMDREERERMVQKALAGMSPTLREVLLLAYFQRLSYAQIAEDLEIPLGTVKSRLHSAVASFAKNWQTVVSDQSRSHDSDSLDSGK